MPVCVCVCVCANVFFSTLLFFHLSWVNMNAFSPLFLFFFFSHCGFNIIATCHWRWKEEKRERKKSTTDNCSQQSRILCEGVACKLYARIIAHENDSNKQGHSMAVTWRKRERKKRKKTSQGHTKEREREKRSKCFNTKKHRKWGECLPFTSRFTSTLISLWRRQNDRQLFSLSLPWITRFYVSPRLRRHFCLSPLILLLRFYLSLFLLVIFIISGTKIYSLSVNNIYSLFYRRK